MDPELQRLVKILVKMALVVLGLLVIYLLFTFVFPIIGRLLAAIPRLIMPFLVAVLIAILIEPMITFLQRRLRFGRGLAAITSIMALLGGAVLIFVAVVARLINELHNMYRIFSGQTQDYGQLILDIVEKVQVFYLRLNLPKEMENTLQANLYKIMGSAQDLISIVVNALISFVTSLPSFFIFLIIAMVATYFIAHERPRIWSWFLGILPQGMEGKTRNVIVDLANAFLGFVRAYSILVTLTAVLTIIGLTILGVPYAFTIGILTGLFDILPVLGPGTIFVPWVIFEILTGHVGFGIGLLVLYTFITVVRQVMEPRVVGDSLGLHPLATLISLYVGLKAGGVVGMFLGPVTVILFMACLRAGVFDGWLWRRTR